MLSMTCQTFLLVVASGLFLMTSQAGTLDSEIKSVDIAKRSTHCYSESIVTIRKYTLRPSHPVRQKTACSICACSRCAPADPTAPKDEPAIVPYSHFDKDQAIADAKVLRTAMKGWGTDEDAIIKILGTRSTEQRNAIERKFKSLYGKDLYAEFKSELSGRFDDLAQALLLTPRELDVIELRRAMRYEGTNEATLMEILLTKNNAEIRKLKRAYGQLLRGRDLEEDIKSETSGYFRRLLVTILQAGREEDQRVDKYQARKDAQSLYDAGPKKWGTDEIKFNQVFTLQSYAQLRAVFEEYKKIANRDIVSTIKSELSGDLEDGLLTLVKFIQNKNEYFAEVLHGTMKGLGTQDDRLIRVIVSRAEIDLKSIEKVFNTKYGKSLKSFIEGDTSGDYKKLLLTIVSGGKFTY